MPKWGGGVVLERRDNSLPSIITSKVELLKIAEKKNRNSQLGRPLLPYIRLYERKERETHNKTFGSQQLPAGKKTKKQTNNMIDSVNKV